MIHVEDPSYLEPEESIIPAEEEDYELDDSESEDFIELEDGSVIIPDEEDQEAPQEFDGNLAEDLGETFLQDLATELLDLVQEDKKAREKRDKQYEDGLRRTGLGDDAPGGAEFTGASKAVHPVLAESCVDFASRAIKELFPAGGPVKMETEGLIDPEQEKVIKATAMCLNDQFTKVISEYRGETEKLLTQLPLGGSQFMKLFWSTKKNRICAEFIPIDNIFIPFSATNFYDADRTTHRQYPNKYDYEAKVKSGVYRDLNSSLSVSSFPEKSASATANEKIEGKTESGFNEDGVRVVYEIYTELEIEEDEFSEGQRVPYIVTIDEYEQNVLSIRRNWDQNDQSRQKLDWIVEDVFIYWMGAYGIGLPHLIGGLSAAATGSLRALLDSAHINNAPTLLKLKGARINGQTKSVQVTQIAEIEGPAGIDDIRKYIMPMPFNAPSPVLFQLLGWLTDAAKGVVSTASEKIADATSNTPVGTVQALIEQGAVIFSSIHSRLHFSQAKKFEIVLRLLKTYGQAKLQEYGLDPQSVSMKGVNPVSDPRIFSEAQRFAQMQGVLQLASSDPEVKYNKIELHRSMLRLMKVNDVERFLPQPQQPQPTDPAMEMVAFIKGQPVVTDVQQDHISHIVTHMSYLKNPLYGMNPIMVPITMKVMDHLKEHLALHFAKRMLDASQPQQQLALPMGQPQQPPQANLQAMAFVSNQMVDEDAMVAQEVSNVINQVTLFVKENMDWMNPDPTIMSTRLMTEAQQVETERRAEEDRLKHEREMTKLSAEMERTKAEVMSRIAENESQAKASIERVQQLREEAMLDAKIEMWKNREDNATKLQIEAAKIAQARLSTDVPEQPKPDINEPLMAIMEGLKSTIESTRAPRKVTAIRDESGEMIGSRSEIEQ